MNIIKIESTSSTNSYLKEFASRQMLEEGTVLQAYEQTAGRGQAGTSWEAEPGKNITCSIIFYPLFLPLKQNFLLSKVIALGVKETLDNYSENVSIKWPNDIYIRDRKVAGILIENELSGQQISQSVVGIGVNINQEIFFSNAPNPVSVKQLTGIDIDTGIFLEEMIVKIMFWYDYLKQGHSSIISENYLKSLYHKSGFHLYQDQKGLFMAEIQDIKDNGLLFLITDKGEERSFFFKEIAFI